MSRYDTQYKGGWRAEQRHERTRYRYTCWWCKAEQSGTEAEVMASGWDMAHPCMCPACWAGKPGYGRRAFRESRKRW